MKEETKSNLKWYGYVMLPLLLITYSVITIFYTIDTHGVFDLNLFITDLFIFSHYIAFFGSFILIYLLLSLLGWIARKIF